MGDATGMGPEANEVQLAGGYMCRTSVRSVPAVGRDVDGASALWTQLKSQRQEGTLHEIYCVLNHCTKRYDPI